MTQTASAPAPTPAPAPAATPAGATTASAPAPAFGEDVPRLLNRLQVLAVLACLGFGVLSAVFQVLAWQANGRAADNTEQVVRIQKIQSSLLRADALATNGFLVGGLESADQRTQYDSAIDQVNRLIAQAAEAQPADRKALAELNSQVGTYTNRITQARDNNRQGFPVGAAYLNLAGGDDASNSGLRGATLPIVQALVDANSDRAADEMDGQHPTWLLYLAIVVLVALFLINRAIARRFHRRYNVGLLVAAGLVAVVTLLTALHASAKAGDNHDIRDGDYRTAVDEASARTAANDAKARESLGLINRGSGAAQEERFDAAAAVVEKTASPRTLALWKDYVSLHDQIRVRDNRGDWDGAVALATATGDDGASAALDEVDRQAQEAADAAARQATDGFRSGGLISLLLIVLSLLAALVGSGAVTWGVNQRRREYA